jgi:hypothetical protein
MNREDIIRLAREAWIVDVTSCEWTAHTGDLERFAALVAAHEREKCAKYLDDCGEHEHANYIRSRGEVKP